MATGASPSLVIRGQIQRRLRQDVLGRAADTEAVGGGGGHLLPLRSIPAWKPQDSQRRRQIKAPMSLSRAPLNPVI